MGSNEVADFYCSKNDSINNEGSLIIRLGDNPNDNFSMPVSVAKEIINSGELEEDSVFVLCYNRYLKMKGKAKRYKIIALLCGFSLLFQTIFN